VTTREQRIADTFVELADTLVTEFDLIDFLHRLVEHTVELVDADAGGLMLADQRGGLEVMAASSHATWLLELFEVQHEEGPCLDAFRSGLAVSRSDLAAMGATWPRFTPRMSQAGFASAEAVPMRLRDQVIGALNVFRVSEGAMSTADLTLAQALADVATVGILQQRVISARELLAEQLQGALTTRVRIEQAKGVLAERSGLDVDQAFEVMRSHARRTGRKLGSVIDAVLEGTFRGPS
jgi:transcriptional regulator with GAF, ATPase, and Fis domain